MGGIWLYILIRKIKPTEATFLFAFVSNILSPYYLFFNYVYTICYRLLIFRILAVYPFSGFGGSRVLAWNKAVYLVTGLLTLGVLWP